MIYCILSAQSSRGRKLVKSLRAVVVADEPSAPFSYSIWESRDYQMLNLFCSTCIQRNREIRHHKCPGCVTPFGQVQRRKKMQLLLRQPAMFRSCVNIMVPIIVSSVERTIDR